MTAYEALMNFFLYGFLGWCAEVAFAAVKQRHFVNRGFLNGPICPIYGVGVTMIVGCMQPFAGRLGLLFLLSSVLVTFLEWLTGFLLEKLFHHKWWDYSGMPLNISGYVCLPFSVLWGVVCVLIVMFLHPLFYRLYSLLPRWLGTVLLVLMCAALLTDLWVTVSGILKFNRRLEYMEELTAELHRISDQIGENIYQNMMDGMEMGEKAKQKAEALKQKADALKQKYEQMLQNSSLTDRRLLKAFPKIQSRKHRELMEELKAMYEKYRGKKK